MPTIVVTATRPGRRRVLFARISPCTVHIKNAHDTVMHSETASETEVLRRGGSGRVIHGPYRNVARSGAPPSKPMPFVYGLELATLQPPAAARHFYTQSTHQMGARAPVSIDPEARMSATPRPLSGCHFPPRRLASPRRCRRSQRVKRQVRPTTATQRENHYPRVPGALPSGNNPWRTGSRNTDRSA